MQQYFENRSLISYENLNKDIVKENVILANERADSKWNSLHYRINHSTFAKMGFLKSKFLNDDLRFNAFIDCYFKETKFENVNFTGSVFINCNFDGATFINCSFDYCSFDRCYIKYDALVESLSNRPNIRWEICKKLSLECLKLGHETDYRKYYFAEKKASEEYYWKRFWHSGTDEYYKKYNWKEQLAGLFSFLISKANKLLWGYGEKLSKLIKNIIFVIIVFACGYYFGLDTLSNDIEMSVGKSIYMSLCNFFNVGCEYTSDYMLYKFMSVAESGIGIILIGFFVAALFRHINRRG